MCRICPVGIILVVRVGAALSPLAGHGRMHEGVPAKQTPTRAGKSSGVNFINVLGAAFLQVDLR